MPSVEEEIIARLDTVVDNLVEPTSYEALRAVGAFPPRHVSAVALRRACEAQEYGPGGGGAPAQWRPLNLQGALAPFGNGFADPSYCVMADGIVHMQGMVGCVPPLSENDVGQVIALLDPDARPASNLLYGCPAVGNNARVDVQADGQIVFQGMLIGGGQVDWFSICGINFPVGA